MEDTGRPTDWVRLRLLVRELMQVYSDLAEILVSHGPVLRQEDRERFWRKEIQAVAIRAQIDTIESRWPAED